MVKKLVVVLVLGLGLFTGHSAYSKTQIDLKHAEDVCYLNMESMFNEGEEQLKKNSKPYQNYFTELNNLSITIGDAFKVARNKVKNENAYENQQAIMVDKDCFNGLTGLANKHNIHHQPFSRVYEEIVEKSLLDQFLDFLMKL